METIVLSALYFLAGFFFIVSYYYGSRLQALILKASVIPFLVIIFILHRQAHWSTGDTLMLAGLAGSWAGDIMLTIKSSAFFKAGIGFFMLTHIMYILVFIRAGNFIFEKPLLLIPLFAYEALLITYLFSHLGSMKIPVIVYSTVIITMLAAAINRYDAVPGTSFTMVLTGAIFFVMSDSALAVNRFRKPFRLHQLVVMLTYIIAQYLIVFGYFSQFRDE